MNNPNPIKEELCAGIPDVYETKGLKEENKSHDQPSKHLSFSAGVRYLAVHERSILYLGIHCETSNF